MDEELGKRRIAYIVERFSQLTLSCLYEECAESKDDAVSDKGYPGGLVGLPEEILAAIVEQIRRPSDKAHVLSTCWRLCNTVAPQLYHDLSIDVDTVRRNHLEAMLNPSNARLRFTRSLVLTASEFKGRSTHTVSIDVPTPRGWICLQLASALPVMALETFYAPGLLNAVLWREAFDILSDMIKTQHRLRNFVFGTHRNIVSQMFGMREEPAHRLSTLTCTDVLEYKYEAIREVLVLASNLSTLELSLPLPFLADPSSDGTLEATRKAETFFAALTCRSVDPLVAGRSEEKVGLVVAFPSVHVLNIRTTNLSTSAAALAGLFDLGRLTHLTFDGCVLIDQILTAMARSGRMHLLSLVLEDHQHSTLERIEHLDELLVSFTGLRTLVFCGSTSETPPAHARKSEGLPCMRAVCHHSATLRTLYIDRDWAHYLTADLQEMSGACTGLEQLGLILKIGKLKGCNQRLPRYLKKVGVTTLPKLATLRVLDYLGEIEGDMSIVDVYHRTSQRSDILHNDVPVDSGLGKVSSDVLSSSRSRLSVVAWGRSVWHAIEAESRKPICYARGSLCPPYDHGRNLAVKVDEQSVKYLEPLSNILSVKHHAPDFLRLDYAL